MPTTTNQDPKKLMAAARTELARLLDESVSNGVRSNHAATQLRPAAVAFMTRLVPAGGVSLNNEAIAEKIYRGQQMLDHYRTSRGDEDAQTQTLELALKALEHAAEQLAGRDIVSERINKEADKSDATLRPVRKTPPPDALGRQTLENNFPRLRSRMVVMLSHLSRQIDTLGEMQEQPFDGMTIKAGKFMTNGGQPAIYIDAESYRTTLKPYLEATLKAVEERDAQANTSAAAKAPATERAPSDQSWQPYFTAYSTLLKPKAGTNPTASLRRKIEDALEQAIARGDEPQPQGGYTITVNDTDLTVLTDDRGRGPLLFVANDSADALESARMKERVMTSTATGKNSKIRAYAQQNSPSQNEHKNYKDVRALLPDETLLCGVITRYLTSAMKLAKNARMVNADGSYNVMIGDHKMTVLEVTRNNVTRMLVANHSTDGFMAMAEVKRAETKAALDQNIIGGSRSIMGDGRSR